MLEMPIVVGVPEQVLPVSFILRTQLTTPKLLLQRPSNGRSEDREALGHFGLRARSTRRAGPHPHAAQPVGAPAEAWLPAAAQGLDVQPGDGLGTILPGETLERQVRFSPDGGDAICSRCSRPHLAQSDLPPKNVAGRGVLPHVNFSPRSSRCRRPRRATRRRETSPCTTRRARAQSGELRAPEGSRLGSRRRWAA